MRHPPPPGDVVTVTVFLPGGSFDVMATVQRHAGTGFADEGAGLLLFALGGQARARWESFVRGAEEPGLALAPIAGSTTGHVDVDAAFLVQLESARAMLAFFDTTIAPVQTVSVTPAYRRLGARVAVSLVHPLRDDQETFTATVTELSTDRPERMGITFDAIPRERRQAFLARLGPAAHPNGRPLLDVTPTGAEHLTEYAFISPRLAASRGVPSPSPSAPSSAPTAPSWHADHADHDDGLEVVHGQVLAEPPSIDRRALFDFSWDAGGLEPPPDSDEST